MRFKKGERFADADRTKNEWNRELGAEAGLCECHWLVQQRHALRAGACWGADSQGRCRGVPWAVDACAGCKLVRGVQTGEGSAGAWRMVKEALDCAASVRVENGVKKDLGG